MASRTKVIVVVMDIECLFSLEKGRMCGNYLKSLLRLVLLKHFVLIIKLTVGLSLL